MNDHVREILNYAGYTNLQDSLTHWRCAALYRGGDNKTALSIDKRTGQWYDFVEGYGGGLRQLVRLTLNNDEIDLDELLNKIEDVEESEGFLHEAPNITMEKKWDISEINKLVPHYKFYEDKGISAKTLKFFKSGMQHEGSLYGRYVFPIFNEGGEIIGWSGRDMLERWRDNGIKWKHLGRKSNWVYPAYVRFGNGSSECINRIRKSNMVILVESIGDMLALWDAGYHNVLVTFGLSLSPSMLGFLVKMNANIVIATNNDAGKKHNRGQEAAFNIFLKCLGYFDVDRIHIFAPTKNDFGDMDKQEIDDWYAGVEKDMGNGQTKLATLTKVLGYLKSKYETKKENGKRLITKNEMKLAKDIRMFIDGYE